ncbi:MAG: hypothetical protein QOI54_806 [Actinomycetota bacterium]|jgi:hypothetical protein|nr:hypothetical protein [Actinomycetota bacterium]
MTPPWHFVYLSQHEHVTQLPPPHTRHDQM